MYAHGAAKFVPSFPIHALLSLMRQRIAFLKRKLRVWLWGRVDEGAAQAHTLEGLPCLHEIGEIVGHLNGYDIPAWVQDVQGNRYEYAGVDRFAIGKSRQELAKMSTTNRRLVMPGLVYRRVKSSAFATCR